MFQAQPLHQAQVKGHLLHLLLHQVQDERQLVYQVQLLSMFPARQLQVGDHLYPPLLTGLPLQQKYVMKTRFMFQTDALNYAKNLSVKMVMHCTVIAKQLFLI